MDHFYREGKDFFLHYLQIHAEKEKMLEKGIDQQGLDAGEVHWVSTLCRYRSSLRVMTSQALPLISKVTRGENVLPTWSSVYAFQQHWEIDLDLAEIVFLWTYLYSVNWLQCGRQ